MLLAGWLTFYAPGLLEEVYAGRLTWDARIRPCPACVGLAVIPDCRYLGSQVWLRPQGWSWEGPFLVADCGVPLNPQHIAEVAKVTADRWGMDRPLWGELSFRDPLEICQVKGPC